MVVIRLWRGVSRLDGTYSRVIEGVNNSRFYELEYSEKRENEYLSESTPMWCKVAGLSSLMRCGFYTDYNTLTDAELVATLYGGE
ncbi:hypothetical protein [Escherichia coli]|uniref:hypothetical protein n=1 Tax=Escherichia coli TaxID=562 RepID=UPI0011CB4282|nr:hypothetical protein [Escherichia coli]MDH7457072.1 hypothetical protein [Escherichia coli]TXP29836.1 hypothetical protein FV254_01485 [Escherichia coli]HAI5500927.1 hypothetical protein [Escherichia coli]HBC0636307.1 hypothetical protein [Escherichia coli]HDD8611338.1 hypothetical protein [Escherichia coli]